MTFAAAVASAVFLALSLLHVFWAFGGRALSASVIPTTGPRGTAVLHPGSIASSLVAFALFCAALLIALRSGLVRTPSQLPPELITAATWVLALVMAGRAVGDFRYVGFFKRIHGTPFAHWDTIAYSPLCLGLAVVCAWVAMSGSQAGEAPR